MISQQSGSEWQWSLSIDLWQAVTCNTSRTTLSEMSAKKPVAQMLDHSSTKAMSLTLSQELHLLASES